VFPNNQAEYKYITTKIRLSLKKRVNQVKKIEVKVKVEVEVEIRRIK